MKTCWPKLAFYVMVASLGVGQMLTACGQSGSLYLPAPESTKPAESPAKTSASEEQKSTQVSPTRP